MPSTTLSRDSLLCAMGTQGVLPLFHSRDIDTAMGVVEALASAGIRVIEFTNRSPDALNVFRSLVLKTATDFPDLVLGAGTILDVASAEAFCEAGAAFIVAPNIHEGVGEFCRSHNLLWCPGAATVTEILYASTLGADLIKIFPADLLGGPAFVKAVRGPCPRVVLMPSGGVTCEESNLNAWFSVGVHCVGLGSDLIDPESLRLQRFDQIQARARQVLQTVSRLRATGIE